MADDRDGRTRRALLASLGGLVALAGCSGFGGGTRSGDPPGPEGTTAGDAGTKTATPTGTARPEPTTASPTAEPEATTETATRTARPTTENLRTPTVIPAEQIRILDREVTVDDRGVTAAVTVENTGSLTFSSLELRVDLLYFPLGEEGSTLVEFAYVDKWFNPRAEDDPESDHFEPGEEYTYTVEFPFPIDPEVKHREASYFGVEAFFRSWDVTD